MPVCSRMKPARIFLTKGPGRFGQNQFIRHEHVAELHAIGARAIHREKRLARLQGDRRIGTIGKEHHDAAILVLALEDGAEIVVGPEIGDPGQRPLDDVAALDLAALQFQPLDTEEALHRIGKPGAAEQPVHSKSCRRNASRASGWSNSRRTRPASFWHQAMKAVAPQTSPIAAIDWMAQRRSAGPSCGTWLPHAPIFAEAAQQLIRIDGAGIDCRSKRCKLLARDPGNLVSNCRCGLIR